MEPMQAEKDQQNRLTELAEKLAHHNSTHGKNVVFWSCKRCHPEPVKSQGV